MREALVIGLVVALGMGPAVSAETIEAPSRIVAVTVFPDRALVTRQAELRLAKGFHMVAFSSLPGTIEEGSVGAVGEGEAKVTLFGAKLVTTQLEAPESPRVRELEEQIKQLNDRVQMLRSMKEVVRQEREFLASIKAASSEQIGKELITTHPKVEEVAGLLTFLDRELSATYQKDQEADIQLRELAEQLDRISRELAKLRGETRKQQTAIVVDLEAQSPGRFSLEVSYRLPGATWQPTYEARASSEGTEVQLVAYGLVRQRTGEDWDEVSVSLSTAKPAIGGRMPEIEPWWLRKAEPVLYEGRVGEKSRKNARLRSERGAQAPSAPPDERDEEFERKQEAQLAQAAVATQGPAVVFTLPKRETLAADWQPRKASIATYTLPADFAYEVTPRLSPYAYLRAKVENKTELVLLPGEVQVFLDGAFVGTSAIDVVGPSETFDLFLGIDERIRVERKQLKAKVDVSVLPGLHGRMKTIDYAYLTTIENFRPKPARITVIDQLPVSQHDDIKIEQTTFDPKPTTADEEKPGVHRWEFNLAIGKKQTIALSYRVRHPADWIVEGL